MTVVQAPTDTPETETPECRQHGPMVLRLASTPEQEFTGDWYTCPAPACCNAVLRPSPELLAQLADQQRGTVTITHTRADGTLLEGSTKGDGVWEIVRQHGFRSSRSIGLYISHSRDRAAKRRNIDRAAKALRAAGWTVAIDIDEDTRRTFAEAEADRVERAEERADRFADYAGNAADRSQAAYEGVRRIGDGIPFGQPILVGHHSERRARRDIERMDAGMRRSVQEGDKANHWAGRAAAAGAYAEFRNAPGRTLRRIAKLEADLRRVERRLADAVEGSAWTAEQGRRKEELEDEIGYWRHVVAKAEEDGFKVWGKADFEKGDFCRYEGRWYEVLRVNAKTLTIPHIHNGIGRQVVRKGDGGRTADWTWTAPYDGVTARRSAEEMAAAESVTDPAAGESDD